MAHTKKKKHNNGLGKKRNVILSCVAKNDPTRYRTRTVESEKSKQKNSRARRKETDRKQDK